LPAKKLLKLKPVPGFFHVQFSVPCFIVCVHLNISKMFVTSVANASDFVFMELLTCFTPVLSFIQHRLNYIWYRLHMSSFVCWFANVQGCW